MKAENKIRTSEGVNQVMGFQEWGLIIILSILWGGSFFFVGVAVKEIPPLTIVLYRVPLASIILLSVVYLAYIIYFRVLATAGPTNLLLVTFLIPLSVILLGVMALGERLEWNAFVGMGLIFLGLIAIDGRLLKMLKRNEENA